VITVATENGHVDLLEAFGQLATAGLYSILCEGGATLGAALLEADLVDRIYTFVAPKVFGTAGTAAFPRKNPLKDDRFRLCGIARHGEDALLMLDRCSQD
jgi:diaminohydroxyphosphoribosylaminopyrimidine deaminase / 5-amino-6-(5-phosphoribosylamino)uracil reductase